MKHVDYNTAAFMHDICFDEYTPDLYMHTRIGIKGVKGDPKNPEAERTWHTGDLCERDEEWGIIYPSANWIPAPFVFDAVNWFETYMGIKIIPIFTDKNTWSFDIRIPEHLTYLINKEESNETITIHADNLEFNSLQETFDNALKFIVKIGIQYNWKQKISDKLDSMNKLFKK